MIDTHAHLDACEETAAALLERARRAGVTRVIAIGTGVASSREALALADAEDGVAAVLGIHPHQAGGAGEADVGEVERLLRHPRAVGVGETGLDYYRDYAPRPRQAELFRMQAALAEELGKPLVVHTRAADDDTLALLSEVSPPAVVLHCFSSVPLLRPALERGYYVSFAGNVTYPKAVDLRLASTQVPATRLLAETDSPYLAPQNVRGQPNEPANVVHVVHALARARGDDPAELAQQIDENARRVFGLR